MVGSSLHLIQQLVGINTALYYGPTIIKETGLKLSMFKDQNQMGVALTILLKLSLVIGTLTSTFLIDNLGRRYIILRSLPVISISMVMTAVAMYSANYTDGISQKIG